MKESISIIGMASVIAETKNYYEFWHILKDGVSTVRDFPESRINEISSINKELNNAEMEKGSYLPKAFDFDPKIFSISEEESRYIDPQDRLLLQCTENAIFDAGYSLDELKGKKIGVFIGNSPNYYSDLFDNSSPFEFLNALESSTAARIAYTFDFRGELLCTDSACSSGLSALVHAYKSLMNDEMDFIVVGSSNLNLFPVKNPEADDLTTTVISSTSNLTKAFDNDADGFMSGEGCVVFLLKKTTSARRDRDNIHAIIRGGAINSNGRSSNGIASPSSDAQAEVIKQAVKSAEIDPSTISYIETHGTGTKIGDPVEVEGISKAYKEMGMGLQSVGIGSVKSNVGHTGSVAGLVGVLKVILMMKYGKIVPSINIKEPNNLINFGESSVYLCTSLEDWQMEERVAGVSSFGLTGINTHVILSEGGQAYDSR